ncbi:hypothetical protein TRAPUB_1972 [Trametes pubescens]|uniref:Uncharacterized protein n=1 Tax=Trametes pubescens TaxID=154538 RepID=A0A1M2VHU5_TRAPU|nr:hypothetical protein TRAPUB_1972 [Trametes pubescens]
MWSSKYTDSASGFRSTAVLYGHADLAIATAGKSEDLKCNQEERRYSVLPSSVESTENGPSPPTIGGHVPVAPDEGVSVPANRRPTPAHNLHADSWLDFVPPTPSYPPLPSHEPLFCPEMAQLDGDPPNPVEHWQDRPGEIPKPARISHYLGADMTPGNLAHQMALARTGRDLRLFCKVVARIATLNEEVEKEFHMKYVTEKCPGLRKIVDIVTREFPFMNAYENVWPIIAIVREHRHRKKYTTNGLIHWEGQAPALVEGENRRVQTASMSPRRDDSRGATGSGGIVDSSRDAGPSDLHYSVRYMFSLRHRPPVSQEYHPCQFQHIQRHHEPDAQVQVQPSSGSTNPGDRISTTQMCRTSGLGLRPAPVESSARSLTATGPLQSRQDAPGRTDKRGPVFDFLGALSPEQTSLLSVFVSKGIVDGAALDGFAEFPSKRRKLLLNSWLREETITELQFEVLNEAFESMGAEARMG